MALLASPVDLPNKVTSGYTDERPKYGRRHGALDFKVPVGSNVYAIEAGTVKRALDVTGQGTGRGKFIEIDHKVGPYSAMSRYLHNSELLVSAGDKVTKGQLIAKSGDTDANAPHVHVDLSIDPKLQKAFEANFGVPPGGWVEANGRLLVPLEGLITISSGKGASTVVRRKPKAGGLFWLFLLWIFFSEN